MTLWAERDEPVLRYLVEAPPRARILVTYQGREEPHDGLPQLSHAQFHAAVEVLHDAGYVDSADATASIGMGRVSWTLFQVTGAGKQALGLWPRFDALGAPGELAALLEALADEAPTEEEETNLRKAAGVVRKTAPAAVRQLLTGALSAYARSHLGL